MPQGIIMFVSALVVSVHPSSKFLAMGLLTVYLLAGLVSFGKRRKEEKSPEDLRVLERSLQIIILDIITKYQCYAAKKWNNGVPKSH